MTAPRFFLVTNDAGRAALELWCHPGNLPPSIAVVDNPDHMLKIPNGAQVRCYWYGTPEERTPWENFWTIRRVQGGFDWISEEDWSTIMDWAERSRKAAVLRLNSGIDLADLPAPSGGDAPALPVPEIATANRFLSPPAAAPAVAPPTRKGTKWT